MFFTGPAFQSSFCMVDDGEVAPLLRTTSNHLKDYPIYYNLPILQIDVISTNINSPYPVSIERLLKFDIFYHVIVDILCEHHINKQFCYYCSVEYYYGDCGV